MSNLHFELLKWQQRLLQDKTRFQVVVAGRRCGKTRFAAVKLIVEALKCRDKLARVMYVAPTQGMAHDLMWDLIHEVGGPVIRESQVSKSNVTLYSGVTIQIRGADNPDRLRGKKLAYAVLDEMKDMKDEVWDLNVRPSLADMKGGALIIGTPEPGETLFRQYFELGQEESDPEWRSWHFTTYDNETIDPAELEAARRSMSTMAFKQEFMADFDTQASEVFKQEWFRWGPEPRGGDYYIAVDLAGFEEVSQATSTAKKKYLDDTAIAVVKITDDGKWWVKKVEMFRKDVRETAVRVLMAIRTYKPIMIGIEKGALMRAMMPYLTDLMRKNNVYAHIEPISTSGSTKKGSDAIANRVIFALQGLMEHGRIVFNEELKGSKEQMKLLDQILMFPSPKAHDDGCFPSQTPIITLDGVKPIVEVTKADFVLTRNGYRKVLQAWCRGTKEVITRFGITATPDHKIWTENRGWVALDSLCKTDILAQANRVGSTSCDSQSCSTDAGITDTQTPSSQTIGNTTHPMRDGKKLLSCSIGKCGSSTMDQSLTDIMSTISTGTPTTTTSATSSVLPNQPINWSIEKKPAAEAVLPSIWNTWREYARKPRHGTRLQRDESGIDNMPCGQSPKNTPSRLASSAERCTDPKSIAPECAARSASGHDGTIYSDLGGVSVPVYDLMVEGDHEFFAWGVLAHNCDALSLISHLHKTTYGDEKDYYEEPEILDDVLGF